MAARVLGPVLMLVSVALALLLYSLLPESTAAAVSSRLDPSIVAAIAHEDALHGAHVFVGVDQWTDGNNELCERETSGDGDEPEPTDPTMRCPVGCEEPAVQQGRVRRALNTLSDDEWSRVVAALRTMQEVPTAEGVARFGGAYRDYSFHAVFHAVVASGNHAVDMTYLDMTGGGPQQPTWHALELLMFENSLLAVDPSIVALPYLDWSAMDAEAYDRYFGTGSGGTPDDCEEGDGVYLVDSGPFALWPVPRWSWREWYGEQIDEVKELLAEVDAFWDNASAWIELTGVNTTLEQLLALTGDQLRSNEHTSTPYLVRGRVGDDFWQAMTRVDWAAAVAECTSDALGWHNEFEACMEGRLTTQAIYDADGSIYDPTSPRKFALLDQNGISLVHDMHLVPHMAVGGARGDMVDTRASGFEPIFWFHHAGIDWLRRSWQHNNERLRPWAYGYPARSGYNFTPTGLYDCLGCGAYGLGFDGEHLEELGRRRGNASAADVLCGEIDTLYTYDSVLRATRAATSAHARTRTNAGITGAVLLAAAALLVHVHTRSRRAGRQQLKGGASEAAGYDMRVNAAAQAGGGEAARHHAGLIGAEELSR